jgi:pimeloyl-ACP methyl ester carboxylesterase
VRVVALLCESMLQRFALLATLTATFAACSGSDDKPVTQQPIDAGADTDVPDPALAIACADPEAAVYGDPGALPAEKGAIIKCSKGDRIDKATLEAKARANGYAGKPFTSGAKIYRVLFRTERGDAANSPGYSSAIVYLPDTPRAQKSPLLLVAHGSRGQTGACAPSRMSPEGEYVRSDFENMTLPLVGAGLPVIAPDWAGYANFGAANNPPSAYAAAVDVGKSTLDATRAFRKIAPSLIDENVVLFGHSQGGHAALATLAMSETYGLAGKLTAVVTFAPLWLAQRSWGAILLIPSEYTFAKYRAANAVSLWYHYTHGELLDGPGHGVDVFRPEKRAAITEFVNTQCWAGDYPKLLAMGSNPSDIFDPAFSSAVAAAAGAGDTCGTEEPQKSLCEKWMKRYADDRPHLMGNAAKTPILFLYGNKDTTIAPDRASCARDRLDADMANVTYCVEPEADHGGIVKQRLSYAIDWLLAQNGIGTAPTACEKGKMDIAAECNPLPPNE